MFKGMELYSWLDPATKSWHFTLLPGTNRRKSDAEIRESREVALTVGDIERKISRLAPGEQVFWTVPSTGAFSLPPVEVVDANRKIHPMPEEPLNILAITFEFGLPAALIFMVIRKPSHRKFAVSLLGAITPLLITYVHLIFSYLMDPVGTNWAFHAAWIMSLFVYVLLVIGGLILSIFDRPHNLIARFFVATLIGPGAAIAFYATERIAS
jgi:hypothetical protein